MSEKQLEHLQDLILVAGHAPFDIGTTVVPPNPERDGGWKLEPYQFGEPPFYIEHIRRGVVLCAHNPAALLVFSGGTTRENGGWSEAETYKAIADKFDWWIRDPPLAGSTILRGDVKNRSTVEICARDSFENLLCGICKFQLMVGRYPRNVTVVGWAFKRTRFELHRAAIRFPSSRMQYDGFNDPLDMKAAWKGERNTISLFIADHYGTDSAPKHLGDKRKTRTRQSADGKTYFPDQEYLTCAGLKNFIDFIYNPQNCSKDYPQPLPWED